ncbi:MAG: hypothetical protein ABW217_02995 [Polyangiaceae bacterium]
MVARGPLKEKTSGPAPGVIGYLELFVRFMPAPVKLQIALSVGSWASDLEREAREQLGQTAPPPPPTDFAAHGATYTTEGHSRP